MQREMEGRGRVEGVFILEGHQNSLMSPYGPTQLKFYLKH